MHLEPTILRRIFARTKRNQQAGCWEWQGARNHGGYGAIGIHGRPVPTHRAVYLALHPNEPPPIAVCHHCDNPPCVRPSHLYGGDHQTNADDCKARGRRPTGPRTDPTAGHYWEIVPFHEKLRWIDIPRIRYLAHERGEPFKVIGRRYGVTHHTIRRIAESDFWPHDLPAPRQVNDGDIPPLPSRDY